MGSIWPKVAVGRWHAPLSILVSLPTIGEINKLGVLRNGILRKYMFFVRITNVETKKKEYNLQRKESFINKWKKEE